MNTTPRPGYDNQIDRELPAENFTKNLLMRFARSATLKEPRLIALSVMLIGVLTLAVTGCDAIGVSADEKHGTVNGNRTTAAEQKLSGATQKQVANRAIAQDDSPLKTLKGHTLAIGDINFSPDGQTVASGSWDGTAKLWKRDGTLITTLKSSVYAKATNFIPSVFFVRFSPDAQTITSGSWNDGNDFISLWKRDGTLISRVKSQAPITGFTLTMDISPDAQTIASGGLGGNVKGMVNLWKRDGTLITTLKGHSEQVEAVSFSPDGQLIVSGDNAGIIKLWKPDGTRIRTVTAHTRAVKDGSRAVRDLSFSPYGQTIVTAGGDGTIKLWKRNGTLITTLKGHTDGVNSIRFSPDGQTIASGSSDKTIKLWQQDGTLIKTLKGHTEDVMTIRFSPDGQTIASGSSDKTIKLWNIN